MAGSGKRRSKRHINFVPGVINQLVIQLGTLRFSLNSVSTFIRRRKPEEMQRSKYASINSIDKP